MKKIKSLLPNTGVTAINVMIVIIVVISLLGIFTYAFSAVRYVCQGNLSKTFPNLMYILSYLSIIKYCYDYFIKEKYVSSYSVVSTFSLATVMTTLSIPGVNNVMVLIAIGVFVLSAMVKNSLTHFKRCLTIIVLVFICVFALMFLKIYYGFVSFDTSDPFELVISIYSLYRLVILWGIFSVMYFMRYYLIRYKYKDQENKFGYDYARQSYFDDLKELAKFEALAKIEARYEKETKSSKTSKNSDKD